MRRHPGRAAVLIGIIAAHWAVLKYFPESHPERAREVLQPPLTVMLLPVAPARSSVSAGPAGHRPRRRQRADRGIVPRRPAHARPRAQEAGRSPPAPIDWLGQADAVVAQRAMRAAEAARRASALSRWQAHVMPAPHAPPKWTFRWDYAATHRLVPTPNGLVININDRCSILVSGFVFLPFCAIGHIPVHGDLFAHMHDPPQLGEWMVH